jgi:glutaminase
VAWCTVDGQASAVGDAHTAFSIQSICKIVAYALVLETQGLEKVRARVPPTSWPFCASTHMDGRVSFFLSRSVRMLGSAYVRLYVRGGAQTHKYVGCEPGGRSYSELVLNQNNLPHNPLINSGAIMMAALLRPDLPSAEVPRPPLGDHLKRAYTKSVGDGGGGAGGVCASVQRFGFVLDAWTKLCGGVRPGFSNGNYLQRKEAADRHYAFAYRMVRVHRVRRRAPLARS